MAEFYTMTDSIVVILLVAWSLVALKYGLRGAKTARGRMYRIVGLLMLTGLLVGLVASWADDKAAEAERNKNTIGGEVPVRQAVTVTPKPATRPANANQRSR